MGSGTWMRVRTARWWRAARRRWRRARAFSPDGTAARRWWPAIGERTSSASGGRLESGELGARAVGGLPCLRKLFRSRAFLQLAQIRFRGIQ
jgi:hypothetical protein